VQIKSLLDLALFPVRLSVLILYPSVKQNNRHCAVILNPAKAIQSMIVLFELPQWLSIAMKRPKPLLIAILGSLIHNQGAKLPNKLLSHRLLEVTII